MNSLGARFISTDTGHVEELGAVPGWDNSMLPVALADNDRAVYLSSRQSGLVRWEIGTAQTTAVLDDPIVAASARLIGVSPDARWVTRWENGWIEIRPLPGGDWKPLFRVQRDKQIAFTADANWLVYHDTDATGKDGLFRVAVSGGQPERLGDFPTKASGYMWISPDGQEIVADAYNPEELWILENFEPKQQAAK
jgi:hypothetical protein